MSTVVKDLGAVSAYAYAVEKGYTGTEAEFAELMADYAEVGQRAEDAADSALESKTAAQTAATTATNKATEATTAATTATNKAAEAQADADAAALDASQAMSAASTATTKATEATTAAATAVSAKDDAVSANTAAQSAKTAAQTAQTGAETAAASVSASAAQIATNASDISKLKSEFTDLKNGVSYSISTTQLEITSSNQSIKTDGSFANAGGYSLKVSVGGLDKVRFIIGNPMTNASNPYPVTAFVNAGGDIIKQTVAGTYGQAVWYEEDVPSGADYFYINTWTTNATINGIDITYSIVDTIMEKAGYDVDAIKKAVYVAPTQKIVQGNISGSGIATGNLRIILNDAIPIKIGDVIRFKSDNLYSEVGVRTAPPTASGTVLEYTAWKKDNTFVATHDGYLLASFANASTYGTSTEIVPQDYIDDGAILFKIGADLAGELVTQSDVKKNTFISDYNELDYKSYVTEYIGKLLTTSQNTEQFIFYTDPHTAVQYGNTNDYQDRVYDDINFIEAIYNASPISYFLSGGDWLGHGDTPATAISKLSFADGFMRKKIHHYYPMLGNHDVNEQGVTNVGDAQGTGKLDNATLTNVWQIFRENQQMYYTVSAPNSKVYVFNSGGQNEALGTYQYDQLKWFANALENDNSPHIILAIHILYISVSENTIQPISNVIMQIAQAYNARGTITVDSEVFDFTNATGKISFCIAGHYHGDASGTLYDIPYVITKDGTAMDTTDKLCTFDMCIADWEQKKLYTMRVGDGTDRTINIL